jgi:hypothetical protein
MVVLSKMGLVKNQWTRFCACFDFAVNDFFRASTYRAKDVTESFSYEEITRSFFRIVFVSLFQCPALVLCAPAVLDDSALNPLLLLCTQAAVPFTSCVLTRSRKAYIPFEIGSFFSPGIRTRCERGENQEYCKRRFH